MNKIKTVITIFVAVLILGGIAVSQNRSRSKTRTTRTATIPSATPAPGKRLVTINLKQGDPMQGYFLRADADTVQVEVKKKSLAIRLNEIESLNFGASEATAATARQEAPVTPAVQPTPDPILPAARKAYAALRKLSDAAKIGLPYLPYADLVIEVRPVIDESLSVLPEGALKADISAAMEAYVDAGQAWSMGLRNGALPISAEPGAGLMKKYGIKPAVNALGQEDHLKLDTTLSAIWTAAGTHLNNIAMLLKQ